MRLPRYTYHVLETWPDGATTARETDLTWNAAHDAAREVFEEDREFRVECVERSPRGHALRIIDMTAQMLTEKAFERDPCPDCGFDACKCDEPYEAYVAERLEAAE